jgi:hypothetical protein
LLGRRFLSSLLLLLLAACAPRHVRYRPLAPLVAEAAGARAEVHAIETATSPTGFVVAASVAAPGALAGARLSSQSAQPCTGSGPAAAVIEVDGAARAERPLPLGPAPKNLRLAFPNDTGGPRDMQWSGFLDLALTDGARTSCLRTPLAGHEVTQGWRRASAWSMGWNLWFFPPFYLGASLGRWLGPLRLGADLGASSYQCPTCTPGAGYLLVPASLTAESYLSEPSTGVAAGLKLAYDVAPGFAVSRDRRDGVLLHGPRVELKLAITQPSYGLPHGPQTFAWYLTAMFGRWGPHGPSGGSSFAGVGLGWDHGL